MGRDDRQTDHPVTEHCLREHGQQARLAMLGIVIRFGFCNRDQLGADDGDLIIASGGDRDHKRSAYSVLPRRLPKKTQPQFASTRRME